MSIIGLSDRRTVDGLVRLLEVHPCRGKLEDLTGTRDRTGLFLAVFGLPSMDLDGDALRRLVRAVSGTDGPCGGFRPRPRCELVLPGRALPDTDLARLAVHGAPMARVGRKACGIGKFSHGESSYERGYETYLDVEHRAVMVRYESVTSADGYAAVRRDKGAYQEGMEHMCLSLLYAFVAPSFRDLLCGGPSQAGLAPW